MSTRSKMTSVASAALLMLMAASAVSGFTSVSAPFSHQVALFAKKSKKSTGKGFGKAVEEPTAPADAASAVADEPPKPRFLQSVEGGSDARPVIDESIPVEDRTANVLRQNFGMRTREEVMAEKKRAEQVQKQRAKLNEWKVMAEEGQDFDIMSIIPAPILVGIDRFLKIGVALCTVLFVAAGGAITVEAWSKASNSPLPDDIDSFIVNTVEPNFTPGLLVLLGFSVSLGAFAALQLSSSSSTYREK